MTADYGDIYRVLLDNSKPLKLPPPWDFVRADDVARGPIAEPQVALGHLRKRFAAQDLIDAGVVRSGDSQPRLTEAITDGAAAIVPMRRQPDASPFALLTADGSLPSTRLGVEWACDDAYTTTQMSMSNVLIASTNISEVAILRGLGFAATSAIGLDQWSPWLQSLLPRSVGESTFAPRRRPPGSSSPVRSDDGERIAAAGPTVAIVAWDLAGVANAIPDSARQILDLVVQLEEHLGDEFARVRAWRPARGIADLQFLLGLRDPALVRNWLAESLAEFVGAQEALAGRRPATGYAATRAALLGRIESSPLNAYDEEVAAAERAYRAAIQQELSGPLIAWGRDHADPFVRSIAVQLGEVATLLHEMSPYLQDLQRENCRYTRQPTGRFGAAGRSVAGAFATQQFEQYSRLTKQFASLLRTLQRTRDAKLCT